MRETFHDKTAIMAVGRSFVLLPIPFLITEQMGLRAEDEVDLLWDCVNKQLILTLDAKERERRYWEEGVEC